MVIFRCFSTYFSLFSLYITLSLSHPLTLSYRRLHSSCRESYGSYVDNTPCAWVQSSTSKGSHVRPASGTERCEEAKPASLGDSLSMTGVEVAEFISVCRRLQLLPGGQRRCIKMRESLRCLSDISSADSFSSKVCRNETTTSAVTVSGSLQLTTTSEGRETVRQAANLASLGEDLVCLGERPYRTVAFR